MRPLEELYEFNYAHRGIKTDSFYFAFLENKISVILGDYQGVAQINELIEPFRSPEQFYYRTVDWKQADFTALMHAIFEIMYGILPCFLHPDEVAGPSALLFSQQFFDEQVCIR